MVLGHYSKTADTDLIENTDEYYAFDRFDKYCFPDGYSPGKRILSVQSDDVKLELSTGYKEITNPFLVGKEQEESSSMLISDGPMDSPWPMYCHDARHTGRSPYSTADNTYFEKWRFKLLEFSDHSPPIIDSDGIIYVARWDLYAVYPNGTQKWMFDILYGSESAPAIDENGIIYIGDEGRVAGPNCLYAVYSSNGTLKWEYEVGDSIESSPVIGDDGTIYFSSQGLEWDWDYDGVTGYSWYGHINALYPNGTLRWRYRTDHVTYSSPAIGPDGTIYCGSHDNYVYALYPNNGTLKWKFKTGNWVHGSPTIGEDGTVYIGSDDRNLYAFYPNNGTVKWKCKIGYIWGSPAIDEDGTLYVGTWEMHFYAIYPNGTVKWKYNAPGRIWFGMSPALSADGTIYFGTTWMDGGTGAFIALNSDGTERFKYQEGKLWFETSPAIAPDGTVYAASSYDDEVSYGLLHAFGKRELSADADGPYIGVVDEPVQFTGSATGGIKPYSWQWDFGDGHNDDEQNPTHIYSNVGAYVATLTVTDDENTVAEDTADVTITNAPSPPTITGPSSGKPGTEYDYTFVTTDLDDDDVSYFIEWGDGTSSDWFGSYSSGEEITVSHTWSEQGMYTIRAKAKDVFDAESDWGTLTVSMPKNKVLTSSLFLRFLERFPILQKLVNFID